MKCRKCGTQNPSKARECINCGQSLLPPLPEEEKKKEEVRLSGFAQTDDHSAHQQRNLLIGIGAAMAISIGVLFTGVMVSSSGMGSIADYQSAIRSAVIYQTDGSEDITGAEDGIDTKTVPDSDRIDGMQDEQSADSESQATAGNYSSLEQDPKFYDPKKNTLSLPDTGIILGMPEDIVAFEEEGFTEGSPAWYLTGSGVNITVYLRRADSIPFTKSEEEEYFKDQYNYARIEGTETQYFYVQYPDEYRIRATIVDHDSKQIAEIDVSAENADNLRNDASAMNKCYTVINKKILDESTIVKKAGAQQ